MPFVFQARPAHRAPSFVPARPLRLAPWI